ncbi:hypothetical protein BN1708_004152, partial [Verticillium longisporum]
LSFCLAKASGMRSSSGVSGARGSPTGGSCVIEADPTLDLTSSLSRLTSWLSVYDTYRNDTEDGSLSLVCGEQNRSVDARLACIGPPSLILALALPSPILPSSPRKEGLSTQARVPNKLICGSRPNSLVVAPGGSPATSPLISSLRL